MVQQAVVAVHLQVSHSVPDGNTQLFVSFPKTRSVNTGGLARSPVIVETHLNLFLQPHAPTRLPRLQLLLADQNLFDGVPRVGRRRPDDVGAVNEPVRGDVVPRACPTETRSASETGLESAVAEGGRGRGWTHRLRLRTGKNAPGRPTER